MKLPDIFYLRHIKQAPLRKTVWIAAGAALLFGVFVVIGHVSNATISVVNRIAHGRVIRADSDTPKIIPIDEDPEYTMPDNDKSRLDILILGIRGKDDPSNGGLLTDTNLLFSLDTATGVASLISIPRDLTVRITDERTGKINEAYAHYGVPDTKTLFSRILGVRIDNVIVADFEAFRSIVDTLGGISITLATPFIEGQQWGNEFNLPAGVNILNGEQALYYARSRYSTSDFDRSRRQMQVMLAIKEKATALSLTKDPLKILSVVTSVRKHVATDLDILDLSTIKDLLTQQDKLGKIRRYQMTTENVLYETKVNGVYELLARDNTLKHIKKFVQTVLTDSPVLPTPAPAESAPGTPSLSATPIP